MIKKVTSLAELRHLAESDPTYAELAMVSARNLGGDPGDVAVALWWLGVNTLETGEAGVLDEVNFCRDLVSSPKRVGRRT